MTPIGHCLIGATVGVLAMPAGKPWPQRLGIVGACIFFANLPDFRIANWGHDDYLVSHSLFTNAALIVLLAGMVALASKNWSKPVPWRWIIACGAAWMSHLLLDSLYNHRKGLRAFWPVSDSARLNLSTPWFSIWQQQEPVTSAHNITVFGLELAVYGTILLAAIWWRYLWLCAKNKPHRVTDAA